MTSEDIKVVKDMVSSKHRLVIEMAYCDTMIVYNYFGDVWEFLEGQNAVHYKFPKPSELSDEILDKVKEFAYEDLADDRIPHLIDCFKHKCANDKDCVGFYFYGLIAHYFKSMGLEEFVYECKAGKN